MHVIFTAYVTRIIIKNLNHNNVPPDDLAIPLYRSIVTSSINLTVND
uniref:Uncharacterized protein n=1 Tax=Arundo donax TaxID=35708 RepID=A0A0A9HJP7_ARUDO